ncbi:hypothetical protein AAAV73_10870, partial [Hominicoprocola fusiformis]
MIYKFTEVLNDLVNYFILGDILLLESWKRANNLSDDLATEFTTNESGDRAFSEGIVIPMSGIENYPYTVLFNLSGDKPELCKGESRLQFRRSGYSLKVDNNMLMLFTWHILKQFNQAVGKSLRTHNLKPKKGAQVMRKNEKITALYERLSRDDFGKDDDQQRESNSISNQKAMLEEFAARQGFTNIVHFTDDGISGT